MVGSHDAIDHVQDDLLAEDRQIDHRGNEHAAGVVGRADMAAGNVVHEAV